MSTYDGKIFSEGVCVNIAVLGKTAELSKEVGAIAEAQLSGYRQCTHMVIPVGKEALISKVEMWDIVIFDISLPKMGEMQIAKEIYSKNPRTKIIFVAIDDCYIQEAFKVRAYRYLYIRDIKKALPEALHDALCELDSLHGSVIESEGIAKWIFYKDICYIESIGDYTSLYFKESYITVKKTLHSFLELLGEDFYQCHKSYIINLRWIHMLQEQEIELINRKKIPVSVRRKKELEKTYYEYLRKNAQ